MSSLRHGKKSIQEEEEKKKRSETIGCGELSFEKVGYAHHLT